MAERDRGGRGLDAGRAGAEVHQAGARLRYVGDVGRDVVLLLRGEACVVLAHLRGIGRDRLQEPRAHEVEVEIAAGVDRGAPVLDAAVAGDAGLRGTAAVLVQALAGDRVALRLRRARQRKQEEGH